MYNMCEFGIGVIHWKETSSDGCYSSPLRNTDSVLSLHEASSYQCSCRSLSLCMFSSHVYLFWLVPPELSVQSMLSVRCTRQQDALTTTTTTWSSWSMWLYVLQSRTLAVGTCQSTWPHPQGPSLSCSPTGRKIENKTRWEMLSASECKTEFISDVLTHWV